MDQFKKIYAIVKENKVIRIIKWDGVTQYDFTKELNEGETLVDAPVYAKIGSDYINGVFSPDDRNYTEKREEQYLKQLPIGDQLDSILKFINSFYETGQEIPSEMEDTILTWKQIKEDFPKE